jgi:hypothetical protein
MSPPLQPQTFRFPLLFTGILILGSLFFGAGGIACALPDQMPGGWVPKWDANGNQPPPLWATLVLFGFAVVCGFAAWLTLEHVTINEVGITSKRPGQEARHLAWGDIHRLRERPGWQLLELYGDSGQLPVHVQYPLKGFTPLRELILKNAPGLKARAADASQTSLPVTFRCGYTFVGLAFGAILCLSAIAGWFNQANSWGMGFMLAVGLFMVASITWGYHSLTVNHAHLILMTMKNQRREPMQ